jgi:hypothetical protein
LMMKNWFVLILLFLFLGSAACAGETAVSDTTTSANTDQSARLNEEYSDALPVMVQLAAGTLKLEETDLAVDESLAAEILPLWQAAQSLSNSDTAASVEVDAVLNQIQDAMSAEQVAAIAAMSLTSDSLTELLESGAITFGRGLGQGQGDGAAGNDEFTPPAGFVPGAGGGPGGGGDFGGGIGGPAGTELSEDDIATRQAEFASGEGIADIQDQAMVGAVIRLLQTKTGEVQARPQNEVMDVVFTAVSQAIGLPPEELQAEIAEAGSLVAVIEAHGGDVTAVRDAIIAGLNELPNAADLDVEQIADSWLAE